MELIEAYMLLIYLDDTARIRALPWSAIYNTESGVTAMEDIELNWALVAKYWSISKHEQAASKQLHGDSRPATIEIYKMISRIVDVLLKNYKLITYNYFNMYQKCCPLPFRW